MPRPVRAQIRALPPTTAMECESLCAARRSAHALLLSENRAREKPSRAHLWNWSAVNLVQLCLAWFSSVCFPFTHDKLSQLLSSDRSRHGFSRKTPTFI
uniref:Uncharacterized protein n=1 Tax=Cyprinodon variegatus TaxID=28743 RepID=A0A3Q2G047_CYPVA